MNEENKELLEQEQVQSSPEENQEQTHPADQLEQDINNIEQSEEKTEQEKDPKDSFKELREQKTQAEKERDEAYYYINYVLKQKEAQQKKQPKQEEDYFDINSLPDDDLVQGDQFKKGYQTVDQKIQQIKKQNDEFVAEYRLNKEHKDFNQVFTDENVALLSKKYPTLAARINKEQDVYTKAKEVYQYIKDLGIYSAQESDYSDKIEQNKKKPKDSSIAPAQQSSNPLDFAHGFANSFSKADKKRMRIEVEAKIRQGLRKK